MVDARLWRLVAFRSLYVLAILAVMIVLLLPIGLQAGRLPGPDIILAITIAWAMQRNDHLPVVLLAGVFLITDLLLMRPPGLMAVIVVLAVEVIRAREITWRDLPIYAEWAIAGTIISAIFVINAIALGVFVVPQPSLGQTLIRLILTVAMYPVALMVVLYVFRVRKATSSGASGAGL
ncbi:MAG: rod shape-determining protein MreD [Pseudomonadota bacterium]